MAKKQKLNLKRAASLFMAFATAASMVQIAPFASAEASEDAASESTAVASDANGLTSTSTKNAYKNYRTQYADAAKPMEDVNIDVVNFTATDGAVCEVKDFEGKSDCVSWLDSEGQISWKFNVAKAGLYNMEMVYYPVAGKNTTIEMGIMLDGKYPFDEVKLTELDRYWKSKTAIEYDALKKNQKRPPQEEYDCWVTYPIKDKDGLINTPYYFYLSEGEHTLTLNGVKTNIYMNSIRFYNDEALPTYADIAPTQDQIDQTPALPGNEPIIIEAESPLYTTASTLYPTYDRTDPSVSPSHPVYKRYNTIGADTWDTAAQTIVYQFEVPADGWYNINFKARQNKMRGFYSNRRVYVNDVVPCEELNDVKVQYDPKWQSISLKDNNGNDIYLHLKAGTNKIALEVVPGEIGAVMERLDDVIYNINYYYRRILMITGPSPDEYNDYFLDDQIPELIYVFQNTINALYEEKAGIEAMTGQGSEASTLETMAVILKLAVKDPDDIPQMLQSIKDQISAVSAWMRDYRDQPLELDYIEVRTAHEKFRSVKSNFFSSLSFGFRAFLGSFFEDYTSISDSTTKALNVWVSLGRDQATVVNELVASEYNPTHTTQIAIRLVQGAILEASLAGKGPEIALFIGGDFPVVCASRGLLVNMRDFTDYEGVILSRFNPNVTTLYEFNGGNYALPLTQAFPMMFYRTDVLAELGYNEPPESWDQLIDMLPDLQRKYLEVGLILPSNISSQVFDAGNTFILLMEQTGQDLYNYDQASGQYISTTFDTEAAVEAFTKWTKFYTVYDFDQTYDAFTRFRTGEMPILIQNYATFYNQLNVAAPEVKGLWDFTHVPGTYRTDENGKRFLDYTANSGSSGAVIFKTCSDTQAAWDFVKWFTSTEVQVEYGKTIEAIMGPMGRYDTANLEALQQLNWSTAEFNKIIDQMEHLKEVPIIPASYAVTRNVYNAFRGVVNNAHNPRYQLSSYNRDINEEIVRKLKDLGYYDGEAA